MFQSGAPIVLFNNWSVLHIHEHVPIKAPDMQAKTQARLYFFDIMVPMDFLKLKPSWRINIGVSELSVSTEEKRCNCQYDKNHKYHFCYAGRAGGDTAET